MYVQIVPAVTPAPETSSVEPLAATDGRVFVVQRVTGSEDSTTDAAPAPAPSSNETAEALPPVTADEVSQIVDALDNAFNLDQGANLGPLWNAMFWSFIALAAVVVLHAILRGITMWRGMKVMEFLRWPHMEVLVLSVIIPIIAAGGSGKAHAQIALPPAAC